MSNIKNIFEHTECVSEEMLMKYISNVLSSAEKHEVEKHLLDCEMCSDAVEGLNKFSDKKKISSITSALNQKIQTRIDAKKEVKVIFLQQYRTQLAVAASIVLVLGLVWFFKSNMSMKEMDSTSAERMFSEKFEPPPVDLENELTEGKEQIEPDVNNAVPKVQEPEAVANVPLEEAEKKVNVEESPSFSSVADAKSGKDVQEEKQFGRAYEKPKDVPAPSEQLQQDVAALKREEKEDNNFYRSKNAETTPKGNVTTKSEITTRDEDAYALQEVVLVSKEVSKNQNASDSYKEKDKKDEAKKSQSAAVTTNVETVTATGASAVSSQPVQDKSAALVKQKNKKTDDDRERTDVTTENRAQGGEGDIMSYQSGAKDKEEKTGGKLKKSKAPQKVSGGYYDTQTSASAPMPETQSKTKVAETESREDITGKLDSISMNGTFESTISSGGFIPIDNAMIKYDKKDYAGAVIDFEQALKQNPNDDKALFYSAVSYMSLGETNKALANFNKILANKNSTYYDDAQWYSSLAYIKNNDTKNARANLIQLQNNEKSRYKRQADETLKEMNK